MWFFLCLPLEVRRLFHQELGACVAAVHLDVHFLLALRDDYFAALAEFQEAIPDLFTHEMHLARFTHGQALAAAVEPVKRVGWSIDEVPVADVILPQLDELEKGIELPLLQIVCDALYQQAQKAGRTHIGAEEYAALGDVRQVLGRYLDATLRQFGPQQPQARAVLKALVTTEGTKRASFVDEIVARLHSTGLIVTTEAVEGNFLRKLVQARLVRVEDIEGRPRYELAHEFLVQQISTWIAESERELTKLLELIDRAYEAYRATGLLLSEDGLKRFVDPFRDELVVPLEQQRFLNLSRQMARRRLHGLFVKVGVLLLTNGVSHLQTNELNSTCRPYYHSHTLPPIWSKACNPARSGGVYAHYHRVYHGLILSG
jgi:Novel STAND NTPase 1